MKNQKVNDEIKKDPLGYQISEEGRDDDDDESLFSSEEEDEESLSGEDQRSSDVDECSDVNESADESQVLFDSCSEDNKAVSETQKESDSETENPPNLYHSLLYSQRLKSFEEGGWPIVKAGSSDKCTAHELAMAGLKFSAQGQAKCVVCHRPVMGLSRNSDPWEAHQETNSKCPLIKLGKPARPDGYSLQNFFKLIGEKQALHLEYQLLLFEDQIKGMLKELVGQENEAQTGEAGA